MRNFWPALFFIFLPHTLLGQRAVYDSLVLKAKAAFDQKDFAGAGKSYLDAFKALGDKGFPDDRFNAAKALAAAEMPDSAFANLFRLAEKTDFLEYDKVVEEPMLEPLRRYPPWETLTDFLRPTMPDLVDTLRRIYDLDQSNRKKHRSIGAQYGYESAEYRNLWKEINHLDSINQLYIFALVDKYGWLGKKEVGAKGNKTIFLVVQHADQAAQEKYLPLMRAAANQGKANKSDLAMLEDRVLLKQGKKQLYGTQQILSYTTGETTYQPIEDIDHLNQRRAEMNLYPFTEATINAIKEQQNKKD